VEVSTSTIVTTITTVTTTTSTSTRTITAVIATQTGICNSPKVWNSQFNGCYTPATRQQLIRKESCGVISGVSISVLQSSTNVFGPIELSVTFTTPNSWANGQANQANYYYLGIPYTGVQSRTFPPGPLLV
jgi:hypothetical protein